MWRCLFHHLLSTPKDRMPKKKGFCLVTSPQRPKAQTRETTRVAKIGTLERAKNTAKERLSLGKTLPACVPA